MVRIVVMSNRRFSISRRGIMAGLGAGLVDLAQSRIAVAQSRRALKLQARPGGVTLSLGQKQTSFWALAATSDARPRFRRGDELEVTLTNDLPVPVLLNWHGIDGVPTIEPLTARPPVQAGGTDSFVLPLRHAGTATCDVRLLGDHQGLPSSVWAVMIEENEAVAVDRDEVLLIEDWRLRSDGGAIAPGIDPKDATSHYTANGAPTADIDIRTNQCLRIRFINGCQRSVIAIKIDDHKLRVMAIDGQPCEPFLARGGTLVLAPGSRIDAFVDAMRPPGSASQIVLHDGKEQRPIARLVYSSEAAVRASPLPPAPPLPSNGLPAKLDLKSAARFDLAIGETSAATPGWIAPAKFNKNLAPVFRVKRGRVVVLALTNRSAITAVFHLHGHHFRLLDRLDDGWKPFWLDTLALDAGQTQRVAFAAEHVGQWLMESMTIDWASPRLVRWFSVDQ